MKIYKINDPMVAKLLNQGSIGIIPTDTVYGIVARLDNSQAVTRVLDIKNRDDKPIGTVIAGSIQQLEKITLKTLLTIAQQYWPGSVSVVLPVDKQLSYAHKSLGSLPFRIPNFSELRLLANETGPIATTSANLPGEPPAATIKEAIDLFGDTVDFYVDGGSLAGRKPSKIVKINNNKTVEIIREG